MGYELPVLGYQNYRKVSFQIDMTHKFWWWIEFVGCAILVAVTIPSCNKTKMRCQNSYPTIGIMERWMATFLPLSFDFVLFVSTGYVLCLFRFTESQLSSFGPFLFFHNAFQKPIYIVSFCLAPFFVIKANVLLHKEDV